MIKRLLRISLYLAILFIPLAIPISANAAGTFVLNPKSGELKVGQNFTQDIFITSGDSNISLARAVVTFDPTLIQVISASRNNSLFQNFPDNEQTIDNKNGVIVMTGFTQSGSGTLYKTTGQPDLFGRFTFKVSKAGPLKFDWEYSGQDQPFKSVIIADGSPPSNVLAVKPDPATYAIPTLGTNVPDTGIDNWTMIIFAIGIIIGALMIWGGATVLGKGVKGRRRTQVLYD